MTHLDYSFISPMDLSCHVHYKYNCTFTLESKLSNERLIKVSPWRKKKKRKGGVPRLQLSMEQLKRMYSNSADRGVFSESIFAMDDRTAFVLWLSTLAIWIKYCQIRWAHKKLVTCAEYKLQYKIWVTLKKKSHHTSVINFWTAWQDVNCTL